MIRANRFNIHFSSLYVLLSLFPGCATQDIQKDDSRSRLTTMQLQIDILNRCNKPALTRIQDELLHEAALKIKTDYSLSGLFNISLPRSEQQKTLLGLWLSREGTTEDFWKNLGEKPKFTDYEIQESRIILFMGKLTQYKVPLLQELIRFRRTNGLTTLYSISRLNREEWLELVRKSRVDLDFEIFINSVDSTFDNLLYGGCK